MATVRVKVYLLHYIFRFYQAYHTLVMRHRYITGGVWISFQISRSTGVSL